MIKESSSPLAKHMVNTLRNAACKPIEFRHYLKELAKLLIFEAAESLPICGIWDLGFGGWLEREVDFVYHLPVLRLGLAVDGYAAAAFVNKPIFCSLYETNHNGAP